jgi:hypothetical protein
MAEAETLEKPAGSPYLPQSARSIPKRIEGVISSWPFVER